MTVTRSSRDGVPCFVDDRGGPLVVGLTFRVGWADETLPTHGLTHLVEHLALFATSAGRRPGDGFVGPERTSFFVRGTAAEIAAFFSSLCSSLRDLPLYRLGGEARVLATEGAGRGPNAHSTLLGRRFGPAGYGLEGYPEMGLVAPSPEAVQAWATRGFTAANAALWATGPLPDGVRLDLADGGRAPAPVPVPVDRPLPGRFEERSRVVAASFLVPRHDAVSLAVAVLERRARQRLRLTEALSYEVASEVETWTDRWTHGIVAADCLPEQAGPVCDGLLAELDAIARPGPSQAELDEAIDDMGRAWTEPAAAASSAANLAANELAGRPVRTATEVVAALRALGPGDVAAAGERMGAAALLHLPQGTANHDPRFTPWSPFSSRAVIGTVRTRSHHLPDFTGDHRLVVGRAGISFVFDDDHRVSIPFAECAAMQAWTDGARTLWAPDGGQAFVHPGEWDDGAAAVAAIDAGVPGDVVVAMGRPAGSAYLEHLGAYAANERRRMTGRP
ncbi:MAG: hypothetical protein ACT4PW_13325 [Acidimicrobiia bacterium]